MKYWFPALLLSCAMASQAQPSPTIEPTIDDLLKERGLVTRWGEQWQQSRGSMADSASQLVVHAMGFLGVPYRFGGNDAESGLDCSGLVRAVYEQSVGKLLPRRAADQAQATLTIHRSELKPDDLVFFNTMRRAFSHVGIYIGEGRFIHAPRSGSSVRIEDMRTAYWNTRFNGARRVPLGETATNQQTVY